MKAIGTVAWIVAGIAQFIAQLDGIDYWWGIDGIAGVIVSIVLTAIPLAGNVLTFVGAYNVWHWEWYWAALFSGGWILVLAIFTALAALIGAMRE